MGFLKRLWNDERGAVVTAELAVLSTVGVLGGVVGLSAFAHSLNAELTDAAFAFRSLDQSYAYVGASSGGGRAWVAGSAYTQADIEASHAELALLAEVDVHAHVRGKPCPCDEGPCPRPCPPEAKHHGHADEHGNRGRHDDDEDHGKRREDDDDDDRRKSDRDEDDRKMDDDRDDDDRKTDDDRDDDDRRKADDRDDDDRNKDGDPDDRKKDDDDRRERDDDRDRDRAMLLRPRNFV